MGPAPSVACVQEARSEEKDAQTLDLRTPGGIKPSLASGLGGWVLVGLALGSPNPNLWSLRWRGPRPTSAPQGEETEGAGRLAEPGRRQRPALSHRRPDLGPYLLGQLPPPTPAPAAGLVPASASGGPGPPPGERELPRLLPSRAERGPGPPGARLELRPEAEPSGSRGRPRAAAGGTAARDGKRRPARQSRARRPVVPAGLQPPPCPAWQSAVPWGYHFPPPRPRRKYAAARLPQEREAEARSGHRSPRPASRGASGSGQLRVTWPQGLPGAPPPLHAGLSVLCFSARGVPGCPYPGCGMAGHGLLFLSALALELLTEVGSSQSALWSRGTAAACRLDNKENESWGALLSGERLDTWICSLLGSLMVGLSGVFPLLVIPLEMGTVLRSEAGTRRLKQLLSFALGGLLGNVFLHLLPEAWAYTCSTSPGGEGQCLQQQQQLGLWVIAGFLTFLMLEKMFLDCKEKEGSSQAPNKDPTAVTATALNGGRCVAPPAAESSLHTVQSIKVSGYLNLLANTIDNFTHGLAVAASFLVSKKIGLVTTLAILLHEIPHEVGDFAILLRAGFDRWSAAKLQLSTALGGLLGACFAIWTQSPKGVEETVAWILPFTSGGFLYIALVNVLPDLLEEEDPWHSLQQVLLLCSGIVVMVLFSLLVE
ncbi:PREDICTED: zinc transporter ZIP13 [Chrysochloris asiatica]|uniref:Zinc transporter ZIP13 n=1 Tax=Chrysochloris asiatica TaxID=185453 RepID=A0A9B0TPC9_CHRAS|nr:PREDICTED: zinc transporter ZIP13 [Chrysochloris asiatica]